MTDYYIHNQAGRDREWCPHCQQYVVRPHHRHDSS